METVYSMREAKAKFLPKMFQMERCLFVASKKNLSAKVPSHIENLPIGIRVRDDSGKISLINRLDFGGYIINFVNGEYVSGSKLEYRALVGRPGVCCTGPIDMKCSVLDLR